MENVTIIGKAKEILSEIKFKLAIRAISSRFISIDELEKMVKEAYMNVEEKLRNMVREKINDVFAEYFDKKEKKSNESPKEKSETFSIAQLE